MNAETITIIFLSISFIAMGILYYMERRRYEKCNVEKNYWKKKYMCHTCDGFLAISNNIPSIIKELESKK